jgi:hypothetical protein
VNASEPVMTCRKRSNGIETEESRYLGKQPGGDLLTAQVVPGMEVARAWLRLWCGTWEPYVTKAEERSDPDRSLLHQRWR